MSTDPLHDLTAAADALCSPIRVTEPIWTRTNGHLKLTRVHTHTMASLLDQLAAATHPGEVYLDDIASTRHQPRSAPAARLEAVDAHWRIQTGAATWMTHLGLPPRGETAANIWGIVGARATAALPDLRRWHSLAATLTGWERPPWQPDAPCPACDTRALRVRLARRTAVCVACGQTWTPDTIGILAAHVQDHSHAA